jgi:hypothetical protein
MRKSFIIYQKSLKAPMNITEKIVLEIEELHQFFQDWFNGELPPTDESFNRCKDVLAPEFKMIPPNGQIVSLEVLLNSLRNARQSRSDMRIWIEKTQVQRVMGEIFLATYQEWQEIDGQVTARQSSAIFQLAEATPSGVRWLHVHETWIE